MAGRALSGFAMVMVGDARRRLAELPDESFRCCVTSPPYWGLRDYGTEPQVWDGEAKHAHLWGAMERGKRKDILSAEASILVARIGVDDRQNGAGTDGGRFCECGAWLGHLGLEPTPQLYIEHLTSIFNEVRRILTGDGTLWLNIGDCYAGSGRGGNPDAGTKQGTNAGSQTVGVLYGKDRTDAAAERLRIRQQFKAERAAGYKPKDLIGIPFMLAFALRDAGWYWRAPIIWSKPNPMPGSQRDRPTIAHEYLWLMSKSQTYYYDAGAIAEPIASSSVARYAQNIDEQEGSHRANGGTKSNGTMKAVGGPRAKGNARTFRGGGAYTRGRSFDNSANVERESHGNAPNESGKRTKRSVWEIAPRPFKGAHFATFPPALVEPCVLAGSAPGDTVLDPFFGAGTTGVVALGHGRGIVGIEMNESYVRDIAVPRLRAERGVEALVV